MKRLISVDVEGDVDALLACWPVPDVARFTRMGPQAAKLIFYDDAVVHFDALEAAIARHALPVDLGVRYRAHSFSAEECAAAELLMLYGRCLDGVSFPFRYAGVSELQSRSQLEVVAREALPGRFVALCGSGHLMRADLRADLEGAGLATGLLGVPASIDVEGQAGRVEDWLWVSSTVDLGEPDTQRRFVGAFDRARWGGEHWCSSSFYNGRIFTVSQSVYRFLTALPAGDTCELDFAPVEVTGPALACR
ncbi:MAG: hypothetical protein JXD18_06035 [Anaerolineae bacterium]|nr:hypothetical protein [Anaerolineae bacterium]